MSSNMDLDDEDAAHILTSLATPTTSTFGHFRQMSLHSPTKSTFSSTSATATINIDRSRTPNPHFQLLDALLVYDDVVLYLATQHLPPQDFFNLYAISRPFHYRVNLRLTSYILSSARRWALLSDSRPSYELPEPSTRIRRFAVPAQPLAPRSRRVRYEIEHQSAAARALQACGTEPTPPGLYSAHDVTTLLPFCNYLHLCMPDLTHRAVKIQNGQRTTKQGSSKVVPTFKYLAFVLHRARLFQTMIQALLKLGHRLPHLMPSTLCRLSLLMDLPFNRQRLSLLRNEAFFTPTDLYVSVLFFVKVDMAFTDPVSGTGETSLRKLMLGMRGLEPLGKLLERDGGKTLLDVTKLWLRVNYRPPVGREEEFKGMSILGIRPSALGMLGVEGWGCRIAGNDNAKAEEEDQATNGDKDIKSAASRPHAQSAHPGSVADVLTQQQAQNQQTVQHQQMQLTQPALQQSAPSQVHPPSQSHQPHESPTQPLPPQSAPTTQVDPSPHPQGPRPSTAHIPAEPYARARLLRPDELVLGEAVRRRIPLHQHIDDMILYGYVDVRTGENLPRSEEERIALMRKLGWMVGKEDVVDGREGKVDGNEKEKGPWGKSAKGEERKAKGKGKKRMHGVKVEDGREDVEMAD